jgi:Zn-dependent protease
MNDERPAPGEESAPGAGGEAPGPDEQRIARLVRAATAAAGAMEEAERGRVRAELAKLRAEKSSWLRQLVTLAVSVGLFLYLGKLAWGWKILPVILAVIFLHELGHWLGMRLFGYRDVSMVFIPLFGGAVAGRGEDVPGWQRGVVALLGPAPGLVAGVCAAAVYFVVGGKIWLLLAEALLLINGFNLLPFHPLDGGQLLNEVLFCRNRWIELATSVLGAAVIALLGALIWWPLSIAGLVALTGAWWRFQTAGQADRLHARLESDPAPAGAGPAPDVVDLAIDEVRRDSPEVTDARVLAMRTDALLERLKARPPDWLTTLAFVVVHGALLVFALVAMVVVEVRAHQTGDRGQGRSAEASVPESVGK